jgi:hypothetical protein
MPRSSQSMESHTDSRRQPNAPKNGDVNADMSTKQQDTRHGSPSTSKSPPTGRRSRPSLFIYRLAWPIILGMMKRENPSNDWRNAPGRPRRHRGHPHQHRPRHRPHDSERDQQGNGDLAQRILVADPAASRMVRAPSGNIDTQPPAIQYPAEGDRTVAYCGVKYAIPEGKAFMDRLHPIPPAALKPPGEAQAATSGRYARPGHDRLPRSHGSEYCGTR